MTTTPVSPADDLRGLCGGRVHLPGDPGYDAARVAWNLAISQRPAAVAVPHSVDEVAEVVRAAAAAGLRVAPQSTGHAASSLSESNLAGVVIVKMSELTGVSVDPGSNTARVVGGTLWNDVIAAAAAHGRTAMHGSAGDVSVVGFMLGGGLSFYGRKHGVAANTVRAIEVVTADGSLVRATATEDPDLFWALRGGSGNLGVVVAMEIELLPYAAVFAGMLLWDRERSPEVVRAWAAWTREVPDSVTTSLRLMSFPPLPDLPPFLSGRQLVVIDGAVLEDDDRAAELLAPLRSLQPEMDTFGRIPAPGLVAVHMDPPGPAPSVGEHLVVGELTEEAVDAYLTEAGPGSTTSLLFAELRHLGGALARPAEGGGVLSRFEGGYALLGLAMVPFPEAVPQGRADAMALCAAMAPYASGTRLLTFCENRSDLSAVYGERLARLREVRAAVDPGGLFLANHTLDN